MNKTPASSPITASGKPKSLIIMFRVNPFEWRKFNEAQEIGFDRRAVVERLIECKGVEVIFFDKDSEKSVTFPKNFLMGKKI